MSELNKLISTMVSFGCKKYTDMSLSDRNQVVALLLKEDQESPLVEADRNNLLQDLIAETIAKKGTAESLQNLYNGITKLFVYGCDEKEAYYAMTIDGLLEEEMFKRAPFKFSYSENVMIDNRLRAQDMNSTLRGF